MGCCEGVTVGRRAGTTNTVENLKNGQILIPKLFSVHFLKVKLMYWDHNVCPLWWFFIRGSTVSLHQTWYVIQEK